MALWLLPSTEYNLQSPGVSISFTIYFQILAYWLQDYWGLWDVHKILAVDILFYMDNANAASVRRTFMQQINCLYL